MPAWLQASFVLTYEVLRDWQVLVAATLVIWTLRACSSDIRKSLAVAYTQKQPNPSSCEPAENQIEPRLEQPRGTVFIESTLAPTRVKTPSEKDLVLRLETLRNAVRHALAEIPAAKGEIGKEGAALYRRVMSVSLEDKHLGDHIDRDASVLLEELRLALRGGHSEPVEALDGKTAWEWLVRVNMIARNLHSAARAYERPDTVWRSAI